MSVHPVLAATAGVIFLSQLPRLHEWTGIIIVVSVNALAVWTASRRNTRQVRTI